MYLSRIPFRGNYLKRMKELSNYEKVSAPSYIKSIGKWLFYKNDGLQNQSVLYIMDRLGDEKNARVFLNPNQLSSDGTVALKGIYFSHNGKYATYSISRSGSDWQEFYVMDVKTGKLLDDHINWAKFSGASCKVMVSTTVPTMLHRKDMSSVMSILYRRSTIIR